MTGGREGQRQPHFAHCGVFQQRNRKLRRGAQPTDAPWDIAARENFAGYSRVAETALPCGTAAVAEYLGDPPSRSAASPRGILTPVLRPDLSRACGRTV